MQTETTIAPRKGEFAIPKGARHGFCRSCGRDIAWIKTTAGRPMPLDLTTVVERDGERWALNHFATCQQGRDWSSHGARRAAAPAPASDVPPATSGAAYVAERRERYRLADGSLPAGWWLMSRQPAHDLGVSEADIHTEATKLAALQQDAAALAAYMQEEESHGLEDQPEHRNRKTRAP